MSLGLMSFFARAVVLGLKEFPRVNAFLEGDDIVYHEYVHLGIAVSTAYRLAAAGEIPGAFKVGAQWRVSKPKFLREVHGEA